MKASNVIAIRRPVRIAPFNPVGFDAEMAAFRAMRQASIQRHAPFLLPEETAALMPTEAELLATDRTYALAKSTGFIDRETQRRDVERQIYLAGRA